MLRNTRNRKRISSDERRRWLEQHEGGTSLSALASSTGRNIRTIKAHVRQAGDEREQALARTDLYRLAITKHNADLLGALDTMREALIIPRDEEVTVRPSFRANLGAYFAGGFLYFRHHEIIESLDGPIGDSATDDPQRLQELVREHLKRDRKLWSGLDQWQQALKAYVDDCSHLGDCVGATASHRLKMCLESLEGGASRVEEGIHEDFISKLCHLSIVTAGGQAGGTADEPKIVDQQLRYGGGPVVTSPTHGRLEAAQSLFVELAATLAEDSRVIKIVRLRGQLVRGAPPLRRLIGDILLGGIVPSRCSVCLRLGF